MEARVDPGNPALGSPVFNPSPRLRQRLGEKRSAGDGADRSHWSRVAKELLMQRGSLTSKPLGGRDISPLWLIEPRDPGLRSKDSEKLIEQFRANAHCAEGAWPQRLLQSDGSPLHCLYVTLAHSTSADGFYLPNGDLLISRPAEQFRVSRTSIPAGDKPPHRLPSPMEVWRHRLFARTVVAPSNGLFSGSGDLKEAVAALGPERWGPLRPWPPARALPGAAFDHRALGLYVLLLTFVAAMYVVTGSFVAAGSLLIVAGCVLYGIRPTLFVKALSETPQQRAGGVLWKIARFSTYFVAVLALVVQVTLRPDESFFWVYIIPVVALLVAGRRRAIPWLILLALSGAQYAVMTIVR